MIVTDAPPISPSSVQNIESSLSATAPAAGAADFAALLFLIVGSAQNASSTAAAESGDALVPSQAGTPAADAEVTGGVGAVETAAVAAGQQSTWPLFFPAVEGSGDAASEAGSPVPASETAPPEFVSVAVDSRPSQAADGIFTRSRGDAVLAGSDDQASALGAAKTSDSQATLDASAPQVDENPSTPDPSRPGFTTMPAAEPGRMAVMAERPRGSVHGNSQGEFAALAVDPVAEPQAAAQPAADDGSGSSAGAPYERGSDDVANQWARVAADDDNHSARDNGRHFNFGAGAHPETASGAQTNHADSEFVLARTKHSEIAELQPESSTRPHDAPITTFTSSSESSSDRQAVAGREWRPVIGRVASEIAGHVRINQQEAIIQLEPPELGKIKIDLHVHGDKLQAHIIAEAHESHALIENHLHELRQALQAQSLDLVDVRVSHGGLTGGGDPTAGFRQQFSGNQQPPSSFADLAAANEPRDAGRHDQARSQAGRVSVWA